MSSESLERLLTRLDDCKGRFTNDARARTEKLLALLERRRFDDPDSLIRFHEILLFLRAFPHSRKVLRQTESILSSFHRRVGRFRTAGRDMTPFDDIEASGIAGTTISGRFSYDIVRWLARGYPSRVEIDWERYDKPERLGAIFSRFMPLLSEEALVEANIPYHAYVRATSDRGSRSLGWLVRQFEELPCPSRERGGLYDLLEIPVRWSLGAGRGSRTRLKRAVRRVYYHDGPLIRRSDVLLSQELDSPPLPVSGLSRREGEAVMDMVRETTTVRYRELYGITHGDPRTVVRAEAGRGVEIFLWGLPAQRRLPLRGYHAGFTLKNGVPVNYIEAITLFERTEVGFNTFYTYRDGETAWTYARALRLLRQILGVSCVSVDPYQIGFNNDEAIESGAFWFYRKLGFRPTRPDLLKLTEMEERKIAARRGYRTSERILRRVSKGPVIYEHAGGDRGDWDRFRVRNIGMAVQRRMADRFRGDAERIRRASARTAAGALGLDHNKLSAIRRRAFEEFALLLALIPDLNAWTGEERRQVARIIAAKTGPDEARYVRLLQAHQRLRHEVIRLGSSSD